MVRRNSRLGVRCALLTGMAWCLPGVWSCGGNEETTVYETQILEVHDTTVIWDTLFDTMYVAPGRSDMVLFGIVYDASSMPTDSVDTTQTFDSVYAGVTCYTAPARQDLRVWVNSDSVPREDAEREYVIKYMAPYLYSGQIFPAVNMGSMLDGTLWEGYAPQSPVYALQVIVPVYSADTAVPPTFDTVRQTVTIPRPATGVLVSSNAGEHARTFNNRLQAYCYVIPGDSAITMTWNDSADFYVVSAYKLKYYAGYGYELADTPYDTIVTTSVCRLPRGEFSRSTVTGGYDLLEVHFVGINGPEPASWDTLPSFDGRGMALGFSYENDFELLVPIGSAVLAKGLAAGTPPPRVGDPYAAVLRALKLSAPQ